MLWIDLENTPQVLFLEPILRWAHREGIEVEVTGRPHGQTVALAKARGINLSVVGKIGEKMKVTTNFDNNNSFDFQNNMKVEYTGFKEDILKKLEIGNVSLPLNNSLISGAQNLFGVKAQLQFGKLMVTALAATQRGKQSTINVAGSTSGAAQGRPFEIVASQYDDNRHFFLAQFFRDNFEKWLGAIPGQVASGINVTRVEVYSINRQNDTQTLRDVVAFMDMGESNRIYRPAIFKATPLRDHAALACLPRAEPISLAKAARSAASSGPDSGPNKRLSMPSTWRSHFSSNRLPSGVRLIRRIRRCSVASRRAMRPLR